MRKLSFVSVIVMMLSAVAVSAQQVKTFDVTNVESKMVEDENFKFFVLADSTMKVEVSPLVYKIVEDEPTSFEVVMVGDNIKTIFTKEALARPQEFIFEVDSVSLVNDLPTVVMTNGYRFSDPDLAWLAVRSGQHVQILRYFGLTREITVFSTVSRETPLTEVSAEDAMAQAESKLPQMIEAVKDKAKAAAKKDVAALTPVKDKGTANPASMTIRFGRR